MNNWNFVTFYNMFPVDLSKDFVIDTDTNEVQVGKQKVKLTPKEMGVLELLNDRRGTTVSRTELLVKVWGDKFANDQGLTQAVSRLRSTLSSCKNISIRTIPKKGYQLSRLEPKKNSRRLNWKKSHVTAIIIVLLAFMICLLIYFQPIRIRIQKSTVDNQEKTTNDLVKWSNSQTITGYYQLAT